MGRAASAVLLGLAMTGCPGDGGDGEGTSGPDYGSAAAYGVAESETFEDDTGVPPPTTGQTASTTTGTETDTDTDTGTGSTGSTGSSGSGGSSSGSSGTGGSSSSTSG